MDDGFGVCSKRRQRERLLTSFDLFQSVNHFVALHPPPVPPSKIKVKEGGGAHTAVLRGKN